MKILKLQWLIKIIQIMRMVYKLLLDIQTRFDNILSNGSQMRRTGIMICFSIIHF